jgi:hypothetical protein
MNAEYQFLSPNSVDSTKDDFLFLGPRHRFYLSFSNESFGMRQAFLLTARPLLFIPCIILRYLVSTFILPG